MKTSIDTDNDHVSCMVISTRFACVKSYSALLFCRVVFSFVLYLVLLIMEEEKEMIEGQLNSLRSWNLRLESFVRKAYN